MPLSSLVTYTPRNCGILFGALLAQQGGDYMMYRRDTDSDVLHWCRNCSNWPRGVYFEQYTKPAEEELCDECQNKEKDGDCSNGKLGSAASS